MQVKVNGIYYDSTNTPIMIILNDTEKEHIANMGEQTKYCSFPDDYDVEKIRKFMDIREDKNAKDISCL